MYPFDIRHARPLRLKLTSRAWLLTKSNLDKIQTMAGDNAKMKVNDWRLHKADQICHTRNWNEMQNERGLLVGHTRTRLLVIAAARFPIGRRTMPIVNE